MKKIVTSLVASLVLATGLSATDYGSVDGDVITKQDIAVVLQDPRIDFDKLPENTKKQVLEQIVNRKLIAKNAIKNGIEKINTLNSFNTNYPMQIAHYVNGNRILENHNIPKCNYCNPNEKRLLLSFS